MQKFVILFATLFVLFTTAFAGDMWYFSGRGSISLKDIEDFNPDYEYKESDLQPLVDWINDCIDHDYPTTIQGKFPYIHDNAFRYKMSLWFVTDKMTMASSQCSKSRLKKALNKAPKRMFGKDIIDNVILRQIDSFDEENCADEKGLICGSSYHGKKPQSACVACSYSSATMASAVFAMAVAIVGVVFF